MGWWPTSVPLCGNKGKKYSPTVSPIKLAVPIATIQSIYLLMLNPNKLIVLFWFVFKIFDKTNALSIIKTGLIIISIILSINKIIYNINN